MKVVTPKIYLLASTSLDWGSLAFSDKQQGVLSWLHDLGAGEFSIPNSSDPESLVELAARRCYKSFAPGLNPNVTKIRDNSVDYHKNILSSRHGSVLEHSSATFAFEFVSRVFTHELVRHRPGMAFSQESLRYVRLTELGFRIPACIADNPEAAAQFRETVEYLKAKQKTLASIFKIDEMRDFKTKKILTSAFRRIAPIGLATGIIATFNFRQLRWVLENRTGPHIEEEMALVMDMLAYRVTELWPLVFGDFKRKDDGQWVPEYSKV